MKKYAFGVDIGGTTIKIGFFATEGELIDTWEIPTRTADNGKYIIGDIKQSIEDELAKRNLSIDDIEGIGLGVPGPVTEDGTVLKCVNLGWGVINIEEILSDAMGKIKVRAGNDANVAALGEMWKGGGKGHKDLVLITLGTGVGGGIIINGKILAGANGAAGEIGHIPVSDDETEPCGCGKKGCLEQYASANGIVRVAKRYLAANPDCKTTLRDSDNISSKVIFDKAKEGDSVALTIVDEVGRLLGKSIASICCVLNPEAVVIGGGMSKAGELLINTIKEYYKKYAFHASANTEFCIAELGNLAGIYGGAKMIID